MTTVTGRRAAARGIRIRRQASFEARTMLRNGEQLLVAFILPAMAMVGLKFVSVPDLGLRRIDVIVPGVLALAVVSTAFTSQAIATAFDRRNGVLRLLGTTPLGRDGLLGGKALATGFVLAFHLLALSLPGRAASWLSRCWWPGGYARKPFSPWRICCGWSFSGWGCCCPRAHFRPVSPRWPAGYPPGPWATDSARRWPRGPGRSAPGLPWLSGEPSAPCLPPGFSAGPTDVTSP